MKIYHYDPIDKTFTKEGDADRNPRTGERRLIPAFATHIKPPSTGANEAAVFNGDRWVKTPDFRGDAWSKETGDKVQVDALGPLPSHLTNIPYPGDHYNWQTHRWVLDTQAKAAAERAAAISELHGQLMTARYEPIAYDDKRLDADLVAIENINGKIVELESRALLNRPISANLLFWRDADNTVHTFADADAYLIWLRGLAIAISDRTTQLYAGKWASEG